MIKNVKCVLVLFLTFSPIASRETECMLPPEIKSKAMVIGTSCDSDSLSSMNVDAATGASVKNGNVTEAGATTEIALTIRDLLSPAIDKVDIIPATKGPADP